MNSTIQAAVDIAALVEENRRLREALRSIQNEPQLVLAMIQCRGFVFDDNADPFQKLAFTLYTKIIEIGQDARAALDGGE
jgi:hypothetical protein